MITTILIVLVVLLLIGAIPAGRTWGTGGASVPLVIAVLLIVLLLYGLPR